MPYTVTYVEETNELTICDFDYMLRRVEQGTDEVKFTVYTYSEGDQPSLPPFRQTWIRIVTVDEIENDPFMFDWQGAAWSIAEIAEALYIPSLNIEFGSQLQWVTVDELAEMVN